MKRRQADLRAVSRRSRPSFFLSHLHVSFVYSFESLACFLRSRHRKDLHLRTPCALTGIPTMIPSTPHAQAAASAATANAATVAATAAAAARRGRLAQR